MPVVSICPQPVHPQLLKFSIVHTKAGLSTKHKQKVTHFVRHYLDSRITKKVYTMCLSF